MEATVKRSVAEMRALFAKAHEAGHAAATGAKPVGMRVTQHANPLDDSSPEVQSWDVPEGPCGFAWVTLFPGGSREANYAKKYLGWKPAYGGGTQLWVGGYGQSVTRKEAYAEAFAKVLRDSGLKAYGGSRLD